MSPFCFSTEGKIKPWRWLEGVKHREKAWREDRAVRERKDASDKIQAGQREKGNMGDIL